MRQYIIPFALYLVTLFLTGIPYPELIRILIVGGAIWYFRKDYTFTPKLDPLALLVGVGIFLIWIGLEGFYPLLGTSYYEPATIVDLVLRLVLLIAIAPLIEEFFVRNFLARILVDKNWQKVKLGTFTTMSFIITVAFFGFSHNRWLPGIITGILLNWLIWKQKDMNSIITAHFVANLLLGIYIVAFQEWGFW